MATNTTRRQMIRARNLIIRKEYDEARKLLLTLDHKLANRWLDQLDEVAPDNLWGADPTTAKAPASRQERERWLREHYAAEAVESVSANATALLPATGVVIMLLTLITGGIGLGAALFLSTQVAYVAIISALLAGIAGGVLMRAAARYGRVRDGIAVIVFGIMLGALITASYWVIQYYDYVVTTRPVLEAANPRLTDGEIETLLQDGLNQATGQSGIAGFVLLRTQEGIPVYDTFITNDEPRLSDTPGGAIVGAEALLLLLLPPLIAVGQTRKRFCEDTNNWMVFYRMGYVPAEDREEFLALLHVQDYRQARRLIAAAKPKRGRTLALDAARCSDRSANGLIRLYDDNRLIEEQEISTWDYNALIHNL